VVYGTTCTFSPDGKIFAGYEHGRVRLWDTSEWKELPGLTAYSPLGLAFSPDGRTIATASVEGVRLFEMSTLKERAHFRPKDYPSGGLVFSPSGRRLAWIANRSTIHVWDLERGELAASFTGHDDYVTGIAFTPDERGIASCSFDSTILIWDLPKSPAPVEDKSLQVEDAWKALTGDDAKAAFQAIRGLANSPAAIKILGRHLKPAAKVDHKPIGALIQDLASVKYSERERATRELEKIGVAAEPALRKFAASTSSAEARRRAELLLAHLKHPSQNPQRRTEIRYLELLERIGGDEAKQLLESLSQGDPDAALTMDAKAALERLRR
jgi:WD40 repeat protein